MIQQLWGKNNNITLKKCMHPNVHSNVILTIAKVCNQPKYINI